MATIVKKHKKSGSSYQAIIRKGRFRTKPLSRTFDLKRDAEVWAREQERLIDMKRHQDPRLAEMVTLEQALVKYFRTIETPGPNYNEPTTVDRKRTCGLALTRYLGKDISLAEITPRRMAEFRDHRLREGRKSGSTVRQELSLISHLFTLAMQEWELPVSNPIERLARPKPAEGRILALTDLQARVIISEGRKAKNEVFPAYILILMHTGMRASEAAALRQRDVNLNTQTIIIKKTKSKTPRTVPLTDAATAALRSIPAEDYFFLKDKDFKKPNIFKRPAQIFRESWEATKRRAIAADPSIPEDLTLHDIRHSAATYLIEQQVPLRTVADILGHKTIQMTMRYTHPSMEHKAEMMQRIEGYGVDIQNEISADRKALRQLLAEAMQIIGSNGPDDELHRVVAEIALYRPE